ncbi:hypothetical protein [Sinanaerobacter sp. ZZT-01]|uniref:hypothetical protein n=1 Tax=Sinanaerobacter sp. ZZT-01 TaxID=3111540 RepID=UPI002D77E3D8|nr:hypothetical protein [Sinanaerobacter sp. ZZT-01]WRR93912.1 hypothetical protein U5921_01960 [Sinanaerobacter sp. ZZT-01]
MYLANQGDCILLLWRVRRNGVNNEINLYIPTGVKAENELFNGFGRRELMQSVVGSLFGGAVAALLWLIAGNVALTVVAVLSGIFGSVMMCTKDQNNQSVVDQIGDMLRFRRSQQIYPYRMQDEWGMR